MLAIVAHPDDAELGAGGMLALAAEKCAVDIVCLTSSASDDSQRSARRRAATKAAEKLGCRVQWVMDGKLDQVEDLVNYRLVRIIDEIIEELQPELLVTHWPDDSHADHRHVATAAVASARRCPSMNIWHMPPNEIRTPKYAQFAPNTFVDISTTLDSKIEALRFYNDEDTGVRGLDLVATDVIARANGAQVGVAAAEVFLSSRHFVDRSFFNSLQQIPRRKEQ